MERCPFPRKDKMQSPKERYENDAAYKNLCNTIEGLLVKSQFTPSEVRECAVMACMHFEMRHGFRHYLQSVPYKVNEAFKELEEYRKHGDYTRIEMGLSVEEMDELRRLQEKYGDLQGHQVFVERQV
jgi:hypothetical protein